LTDLELLFCALLPLLHLQLLELTCAHAFTLLLKLGLKFLAPGFQLQKRLLLERPLGIILNHLGLNNPHELGFMILCRLSASTLLP
jgi:hypothetical protein